MALQQDWVHESAFGKWFLNTNTWDKFVIKQALDDHEKLIDFSKYTFPSILDVGVGTGISLVNLDERFSPQKLVGVDVDREVLTHADSRRNECTAEVEFVISNAAKIDLPDDSFDMVFCHQTLHHIVDQDKALSEFIRLLKPGGLLLLSESTRKFIHSWSIKLLFRHPMDVQRTAEEYLDMLKKAGFEFSDENVSFPYLWWSRADLGILQRLGASVPENREETMLNVVARKPVI